jgi:hypothetical protein
MTVLGSLNLNTCDLLRNIKVRDSVDKSLKYADFLLAQSTVKYNTLLTKDLQSDVQVLHELPNTQ